MKFKWLLVTGILVGASAPAFSDCSVQFKACTAWCGVRHFDSDVRKVGCKTRCAADRAACFAEAGVDKAKEVSENGADKAKGFWEGFTGGE